MSFVFDPAAIERELTTLQRQLSPSETRAVLYNLVIVSSAENDDRIEKALGFLLGRRPARIIRIRMTDRSESGIHVSARCFPDRENRGVCFQEIHIESGSDGTGAATGTWAPLLVREIPAYLWWMDRLDPPPELLYRSLEHVDKVIIDSFAGERSGERSCRVFGGFVCDALHEEIPVADIAWRKLSTLRQVTAQLFDTESTRPSLREIQHVSIQGGTEVTSVLYMSWLADRLRWTLPEKPALEPRSFLDAEGRKVSWDHGKPAPFEEGVFVRFGLLSCDELSVKTDPRGFGRLTTPGEKPRTVPFLIPGEGQLLLEELDYPYHDYLFAEVVRNIGCVLPDVMGI